MLKENLLIILPGPEDKSITDPIREKFPYIAVQYYQLMRPNKSFDVDSGLPKGCYTILATVQKVFSLNLLLSSFCDRSRI
jgi:hypothetical protein